MTKTVLIVEDDPVWAQVLATYCQQIDLNSMIVRSPQEAMDRIDDDLPDLIILDLLLATETGMALLNELKTHSDLANIPVAVCTSVVGVNLNTLRSFGVRAVLDKTTMEPGEIRHTLKGLIGE